MKRISVAIFATFVLLPLFGSAKTDSSSAHGFFYSSVESSDHAVIKEGRSTCRSILGLIASGDCSISAAARNGKITKIASVDYDVSNILGIIAKTTVIVSGE